MAETVTVTLPDHWLVYARGLVREGRFASLDDAVASGLRQMEADEHAHGRLAELLAEGEREGGFEEWNYDQFLAERQPADDGRQAA